MLGKIRRLVLVGGVIILAFVLGGCGEPERGLSTTSVDSGFPVTVTDALGRRVTIERAPQRIVSLSPSNTEILFALGLGDRVVGVTNYCDYPPEAKEKPKIGGFADPSVEVIVNSQPDLVLANALHESVIKQLEGLGIKVVTVEARDIEGVISVIDTVGKVTGSSSNAAAIIAEMERRMAAVKEKTAQLTEREKPRVYFEIWYDPLTTGGKSSFLNSVIEMAGGRNVAGDVDQEWVTFSPEVLLAKDPQVMIYIHHFTSGQSKEDIKSRKGWKDVSAVKDDRIYQFPDENLVIRPGPRIVEGLEIVARMLHPELFQ